VVRARRRDRVRADRGLPPLARLLRQQPQRLHVGWPQYGEVSVVEGGQLVLSETLGEREHAGIDHSQRLICVLGLQLQAAFEIGRGCVLESVGAVQYVFQERDPRVRAQTLVAPVVKLGEHEDGHDEVFVGLVQQRGTPFVVGVGCVQRRE
jgi:hypothetical protein